MARTPMTTVTGWIKLDDHARLRDALESTGFTMQDAIRAAVRRETMRPTIVDFDPRVEAIAKSYCESDGRTDWMDGTGRRNSAGDRGDARTTDAEPRTATEGVR